jgi:hypothetical protein
MKKRIIFSDLSRQAEITQEEFRKLYPLQRLMQLRMDMERLYYKELQNEKPGKLRIVIDEYRKPD